MHHRGLAATIALVGAALGSVPGVAKDLSGQYGFAGEWTLEASLREVSRTALGGRDWTGTARVTHTGLCTTSGNPEQAGEMTLKTGPLWRAVATLKVGDLECVYVGRLTKGDQVFASCTNGSSVPMKLWER
jgi:hypothetical protein